MNKDDSTKNKAAKSGTSRTIDSLLKTLPGIASQTFALAKGQSGNILEKMLKAPEYMEQIGKAGSYLKDLRQVAGLTQEDLAKAIDLENLDVLQAIEEGRSPVTLDILFRLASFYSRNDPLSFMLNFSKEYAPWMWQLLRFTGIERLVITLEREMKFINIYRSRDAARKLSNEDFDRVITFMHNTFDSALELVNSQQPAKAEKPKKTLEPETKAATEAKPATKPAVKKPTPKAKPPARPKPAVKKAAAAKAPPARKRAASTKSI